MTVATALAVAGSAIGGIARFSQMQYQAAIARANAKQERLNAEAASLQADLDVEDLGDQRRGELGTLRSSQGASGLAVSSPSFAAGEVAFTERTDEENFRLKLAGNQNYAYYRTRANIQETEAQSLQRGAPLALVGSILSGIPGDAFGGGSERASFIGGAAPTRLSPSYVPLPRLRPRLSPTFSGNPFI